MAKSVSCHVSLHVTGYLGDQGLDIGIVDLVISEGKEGLNLLGWVFDCIQGPLFEEVKGVVVDVDSVPVDELKRLLSQSSESVVVYFDRGNCSINGTMF